MKGRTAQQSKGGEISTETKATPKVYDLGGLSFLGLEGNVRKGVQQKRGGIAGKFEEEKRTHP